MPESKVQFNISNVHYAVRTDAGYLTPVHVPGAVSLELTPEGDTETFYADGIAYYVSVKNNGYSGSMELARFPDQMYKDIWGFIENTEHVLTENVTAEPAEFALLFQIDGDKDNAFYCLYNCKAARPGITANTTTDTKTPETQTAELTVAPLASGKVRSRTMSTTPSGVMEDWFTSVYGETMAPTS